MEGSLLKVGKTCGDVVCSIINGIYGLSNDECGGLVSTMVVQLHNYFTVVLKSKLRDKQETEFTRNLFKC